MASLEDHTQAYSISRNIQDFIETVLVILNCPMAPAVRAGGVQSKRARPFRFARFPFRALGYGPRCPGSGAVRSFSWCP